MGAQVIFHILYKTQHIMHCSCDTKETHDSKGRNIIKETFPQTLWESEAGKEQFRNLIGKGKKEFFNSTFKESHNLKLNVVKYAKIYLHGTKIDHKK